MSTDLSSIISQTQTIPISDGLVSYISDVNVKINGDYAVVGITSKNQSAVLVYCRSDIFWNQQALLTSDDNSSYTSVDIAGNIIAIGSGNGVDIFCNTSGSWILQQQISDNTSNNSFGYSIVLSSDASTLIVGAPETNQSETGSTYLFNKSDIANAI